MSGQKVTVHSENKKGVVPAVQFNDPKNQPMGVVVLQEWWGLNQQIKDAALDISKRGNFTTIVPDLYRGEVASDREHAGHLMSDLDWQGAVKDIQGCAKYLLQQGCSKVGVIGFCLGGALALAAAALVPEINAAAPFYGIPGVELADIGAIKVPLQCHFAEKDSIVGFSSPADQKILKEKLTAGGVPFEFYCHPADHAFANKTGPNYNKEEAEKALNDSVAFFQKNLI